MFTILFADGNSVAKLRPILPKLPIPTAMPEEPVTVGKLFLLVNARCTAVDNTQACRETDVTSKFVEHFPGLTCSSFGEFDERLWQFQKDTGTCYARRHSRSAAAHQAKTGEVIADAIAYAFFICFCVHAKFEWKSEIRGRQ